MSFEMTKVLRIIPIMTEVIAINYVGIPSIIYKENTLYEYLKH